MAEPLTSAEAAARLGVKRETLYAYVSRGLLNRTLSLDGRTSLFDPAQIDELRRSRRRKAKGELSTVIATSVTEVDELGHRYRGVPISELTDTDFEAVADLLWGAEGSWTIDSALEVAVEKAVAALPAGTPVLGRYRTAVNVASALDPMRHNPSPTARAKAGRTMVNAAVTALCTEPGKEPPTRTPADADCVADSVADRLAGALSGPRTKMSSAQRTSVGLAMVLLADHGLAASTFSARIAASVRADPYSIVEAGLGTVGGLLHGAASAAVHRLFEAADRIGVDRAVGEQLATGERVPGVGHTVYRSVDPREILLTGALTAAWADDPSIEIVTAVRRQLEHHLDLVVNVDFSLGALTWLISADDTAGEALFALARIVGWTAHGIEEFGEQPVRFRPSARYVRPPDPDTVILPDGASPPAPD